MYKFKKGMRIKAIRTDDVRSYFNSEGRMDYLFTKGGVITKIRPSENIFTIDFKWAVYPSDCEPFPPTNSINSLI